MKKIEAFIAAFVEKNSRISLILVFVCVHIVLYFSLGVSTQLEAEKYIGQGTILYEEGILTETKYIFYLPVILLVYLTKMLGVGLGWVAMVQVIISGIAQFYFHRLIRENAGKQTAFFGSLILLLFIPFQSWNLFLYSDSIFISFSMIYAWIIYRHARKSWKGNLLVCFSLLLLILSRPAGLLFIPPTILYFLMLPQTRNDRLSTAGISIFLLIGMYFLMDLVFKGGNDMDPLKPFVEEHVICFVPLSPKGVNLDITHSNSPTYDLLYYILHNPLHFLKMLGLRLISFFNLTRPFYSVLHNLLLIVFMVPIYLFSIKGFLLARQDNRFYLNYIVLLLLFYPIATMFQCDDWHSRFTMIVIPYFTFFAARAIAGFLGSGKRKFSE